jgi:hypothetical protein
MYLKFKISDFVDIRKHNKNVLRKNSKHYFDFSNP